MASKHREQWIMESVECPRCKAVRGELCRINVLSRIQSPNRPILHKERRDAWREWRDKQERL